MKVQSAQNEVISEGAGVERTAKIKESAKAFHILSGALYSDKILAVVRELSCNAYDAQIDAGNGHIPFELKVPTEWDNTFYIKDFGTGLSEEQVYGLYMTYFESTKTNSDAFIGQLGLGSKSPFSYGATFNVESRQDGVKKVYTCYKNAELVPAVSLMDTAATDEPNGLTISLGAKRADVQAFQRAARLATMYFAVPPTIVGLKDFTPFPVTYTAEGPGWKMRSSDNAYTGVRVIQGAVSYPVDIAIVNETMGGKMSRFITNSLPNFNLDLFVPIGQLDIAPSREALSYDLRTATNLADVLNDIETVMVSELHDHINEWPSLWTAQVNYQEMLRESRSYHTTNHRARLVNIFQSTPGMFNWNGKSLVDNLVFDSKNYSLDSLALTSYIGTSRRVKKLTLNTRIEFGAKPDWRTSVSPSQTTIVVVDDLNDEKLSRSYLTHNLWRYENNSNTISAYVISSIDGKAVNQAEVDVLLDAMGNPEVIMMSDLPVPVKTGATYKYVPKAKDELYVWNGITTKAGRYGSESIGPKSWVTEQIDLSLGGYYLDIERWTIMDGRFNDMNIQRIINASTDLGIIATDAVIVGLNPARKKYVQTQGVWINLIDHIITKVRTDEAEWDSTFQHASVSRWVRDMKMIELFTNGWDTKFDEATTNNPKFVEYIKSFSSTAVDTDTVGWMLTLVSLINPLRSIDKGESVYTANLSTAHEVIMKDNPMLKFIHLETALCTKAGVELVSRALTK